MINRPLYLSRLDAWRNRDVIKVVTGVRRCGKSTLLKMFADKLVREGVDPANIITINLEQLENDHLRDYRKLHDEIMSLANPQAMNYVFIDEVQNVTNFERAVDSLYTRDNIDLYITGSNAFLLGGSLATLLSGRYIEIKMLPLSFAEYASANTDADISRQRLYERYVSTTSFPAAIDFAAESLELHDYLEGILSTVLLKDVAGRLNVSNTRALEALASFMFDNVGNLTSPKRISDTMSSSGIKISPATVSDYINGLTKAYVFYAAKRYDIKGRRRLKSNEKFYAVDMGLRRLALQNSARDRGRILENVIYLELLRRESSVDVGRLADTEVDFVTHGPQGAKYYQVAYTVDDPKTMNRELGPLKKLRDNYPKFLITMDDSDPISHEGIKQINAIDWLLDPESELRA